MKDQYDINEQIALTNKLVAESFKYQKESKWFPLQVVAASMTAGAALFGAGAVLAKLFLH